MSPSNHEHNRPAIGVLAGWQVYTGTAEGYPVVFAGVEGDGPAVIADNEEGIRQAITHLAAHEIGGPRGKEHEGKPDERI